MKKALTIAGSDSGGGAGIQADLKTFTAYGVFGMSAITALTAQNTVGVQDIFPVTPEFIMEQITSVMSDIGTDAAKTGMLANEMIVNTVVDAIEKFRILNVVVDPVMIAKSGDALLSENARLVIKEKLIPLARIVTPNVFEAEALLNLKIQNLDDMKQAAQKLQETGCQWIVIKGGHFQHETEAIDVVFDGRNFHFLTAPRFETQNTHGTGCTFSSAIAAGLAKGYEPLRAIQQAKKFITEAIQHSFDLGKGHGPTNHFVGTETRW